MIKLNPMNKDQLADFLSNGEASNWEYFKANVAEGFDNTTTGVVLDEFKGILADKSERATPEQAQENIRAHYEGRSPNIVDPTSPQPKPSMGFEEWKNSEYYREGLEFQEGWGEGRAKFLAESFDERKEREKILNSGGGVTRGVIGFAGQILGSLPDPVNLIPFGGSAGKTAKLTEKLARASFEGAMGNLAVSAVTRPHWEKRGIDSDWTDYVSDIWMGAAMGSIFGAAGHAFSKLSKADVKIQDRAKIGEAADAVIDGMAKGQDVDISKIEGLQQAYDSIYDIPEVMRSRKVEELTTQLTSMGYAPDEARAHIAPIVAQAEAFSREFNMSVDDFLAEYGPTFQASEMIGQGSARRIVKRASNEVEIEIGKMIDSEIHNMRQEIETAEAGQKLFVDGEYVSNTESTFPQWFKDAGFKSKEEFFTAIDNKTSKFDTIREFAEGRLKAAQDPEYVALTGYGLEDVPAGPDGQPLFQFAGPNAKNAPIDKLTQALVMERDGSSMDAIREGTGWFKAEDGKWRFEIDDSNAKFKPIDINKKKKFKLDQVLEHDSLFEAYPQLKEMNVEFAAHRGRKGGHFDAVNNTLKIMVSQESYYKGDALKMMNRLKELKETPEYKAYLEGGSSSDWATFRETGVGKEFRDLTLYTSMVRPDKRFPVDLNSQEEALNIILHEIQHSIQAVEGFARGGNSKTDGGFNNYRNLHGEIEARNTEARKKLSPEERLQTRPDVQENSNAIVRWRGEEIAQNLPSLPEDIEFKADKNGQMTFFKKSQAGQERGAITFGDDGKAVIHLFESADQSTIIHETGHLFLNNLEKFAAMENASPRLKADLDAMRSWMGLKPGEKIGVKHHEQFARGFEQYLREGRAPRPELESVFSRFKDWLVSIYKSSKELKVNLSDEAREVYSRLLGSESRPRVETLPEVKTPEPKFKTEAEIHAKTSEIQSMVETDPRIATPEESRVFTESIADIETEENALNEMLAFFQSAKTDEDLLAAANKVGISKSKFQELIDDFNQRLLDEDEARLGIEKLIEKRKQELQIEAAKLKQQAFLSLAARKEVTDHVQKILDAGGSHKQAVLSILEGDSTLRGIEGAGKSVDGSYMALAQSNSQRVFSELRKIDPNIERLFEDDMQFNGSVIKEMVAPGSSGDPLAKSAAEILSRYSEELRQRANLAGADIGKLEGHTPRSHDVEKMISDKDGWIDFMMKPENLDHDRVFPGLNEAGKREALLEIYASLVTDNHGKKEIDVTEPLRRVPRNIAKKMGESRSLHFKSAEAELAYLKQFGQGDNILQTMSSHYESMSRKIALMERLGPNPENTIAHVVQTLNDKIKQDVIDGKISPSEGEKIINGTKMAPGLGTVNDLRSRDSEIGRALSMALAEGSGENHWFKTGGQIIRAVNSLSKLGSALLSQPTDFIHSVNERRLFSDRNEASLWVEVFKDYFSGMTPEKQEIMDHLGIFVDSINYKNFNRFEVDNINNKLARANDWMFRWSGQNWHVKHQKQAAGISLARELGSNMSKSWNEIHPGLREMLVQYGSFNEAKWQKIQKAGVMDVDGKAYFHPGLLQKLGDDVFEDMIPMEYQNISRPAELDLKDGHKADTKAWEERRAKELQRARFKLELDLKTFFVEESRNAAPEPDAKVRRIMSFGTKQGTATNEAVKLLTQFKTFAFVNWDRSIKGKRMMRDSNDFGGLIHHAVGTLALGYLSTVLKDLSKGQTPADPTLGATWGRAAAQSGGLGIMGDFFATGVSSRSGADFISSMAGPTFSTLGNFANLTGQTLRGDVFEDGSKVASKWIDFGRSMAPAPVSTLWFTRAAMDQLIWQNLKETLEPGSVRRSQRRLKKELNQKYIVDPQSTLWLPDATR